MSDIVSSLRALLIADSTIKTAFSSQIFVLKAIDGATYPFAVLRTVGDDAQYSQDGETVRETIVQIDVYHDSISSAYTAMNLIRAKLSGYRGVMGSYSAQAIFIREMQDTWIGDTRDFKLLTQVVIKWTV